MGDLAALVSKVFFDAVYEKAADTYANELFEEELERGIFPPENGWGSPDRPSFSARYYAVFGDRGEWERDENALLVNGGKRGFSEPDLLQFDLSPLYRINIKVGQGGRLSVGVIDRSVERTLRDADCRYEYERRYRHTRLNRDRFLPPLEFCEDGQLKPDVARRYESVRRKIWTELETYLNKSIPLFTQEATEEKEQKRSALKKRKPTPTHSFMFVLDLSQRLGGDDKVKDYLVEERKQWEKENATDLSKTLDIAGSDFFYRLKPAIKVIYRELASQPEYIDANLPCLKERTFFSAKYEFEIHSRLSERIDNRDDGIRSKMLYNEKEITSGKFSTASIDDVRVSIDQNDEYTIVIDNNLQVKVYMGQEQALQAVNAWSLREKHAEMRLAMQQRIQTFLVANERYLSTPPRQRIQNDHS